MKNERKTDKEIYKIIGQKVRENRIMRGIKQKALAEAIDVLPSHMNEIEKGKRPLHVYHLMKISKILMIDPGQFLQFDNYETERKGQYYYSKNGNVVHILGNETISKETKEMLNTIIDKLLK